jgi:hypothetical protein
VPSSSGASTPFDNTVLESTLHRRTVSIFPQRDRISIQEHVSGHKTTLEPPVPQDSAALSATSVETDRDEDYEDIPYKDGEGTGTDILPQPGNPPVKRSRAAYKATTVSPCFEQSHPYSTDYILKQKNPLEDLVHIRDILLLELCRHEGLRGLAADSSGFPLCGNCGKSSGTLRCTDCTIDAMYCPGCLCAMHREQPLHRIQVCGNRVYPINIDPTSFVAMDGLVFCCRFPG